MSDHTKHTILSAVVGLGLGAAPLFADVQIWDDPEGDATGGSWFDEKWDGDGEWVNNADVPNDAVFFRPGTGTTVQTREITLNAEVFVGVLGLWHGNGSGAAGQAKHVHHFTGSGPLTLQTRVMENGQPAFDPDTSEPLFGPGQIIHASTDSNNKFGTTVFDVPINAPSGLLITHSPVGGNIGNTTIFNVANEFGGQVVFHGRGTQTPGASNSSLVLRHNDALGGAANTGGTAHHLVVTKAPGAGGGFGPTLVLENDITIAQNIQIGGGGRLHSSGDNTLTGRLNFSAGQGEIEIYVLDAEDTLHFNGTWVNAGANQRFGVNGPGTFLISQNIFNGMRIADGATVVINATHGGNLTAGTFFHPGITTTAGTTVTGTGSTQGHFEQNSTIGGTLNPGSIGGAGTFTVINHGLAFLSTSNFVVDLSDDSIGGINDLLRVTEGSGADTGRLIIHDGATLDINALTGTLDQIGSVYRLIEFDGELSLLDASLDPLGTGFTIGEMPAGYSAADFAIVYDTANGHVNLVVVPEPATLGLLGIGAMGLFMRRRRA